MPFDSLIVPGTGRMRPRHVNVDGEAYECARRYMIRLNARDFAEPHRLARLAETAHMNPEAFRQRFAYLVEKK